jgi:hypothetical protein
MMEPRWNWNWWAAVLNLIGAVLTLLGAILAASVLFGSGAPALAVLGGVVAIVGTLFWVAAAIAGVIEHRRRGPPP